MSQSQIAKQFLASLVSIQSSINIPELEHDLDSISAAINLQLPLPQSLFIRLLTALTITYRKLNKQTSSQMLIIAKDVNNSQVEQFVMIKYSQLLAILVKKNCNSANIKQLNELLIILVASSIQRIKIAQAQYLYSLLKLLSCLIQFLSSQINIVQSIFPNVISNLFNIILHSPTKSQKSTNIAFSCVSLLIAKLFTNNKQIVFIKPIQQVKSVNKDFKMVCLQKLQQYLEVMVQQSHKYTKISNIKLFIQRLSNAQGLKNTNLKNLVNKLAYQLELESEILNETQLEQIYLRKQAERTLIIVAQNIESLGAEELQTHLRFSTKIIKTLKNVSTQQSSKIFTLIRPLFKLSASKIQTVSGSVIPFQRLQSHMKITQQIQQNLTTSIRSNINNYLQNNIGVFKIKSSLIQTLQQYFDNWPQTICQQIIFKIIQDIEVNPYSITMSIEGMKKYVQSIVMLRFFITKLQKKQIIQKLFDFIRQSESLVKLIPTNQIEELLIVVSFDILRMMYHKLLNKKNGIETANLKIQFVEIVLGLLLENNYSIETITTFYLLKYSASKNVGKFIYPFLPTIINRNRHNYPVIEKAILLCSSELTRSYSQYLFEEFNLLNNTQSIIFSILPYLSPQLLRQAILSISTKFHWIDALSNSLQYLNNQHIPSHQGAENFNPNDPDNVVIKNCLGVVLLQISSRFQIQILSNSSKILDLFQKILQLNTEMIFCSNIHEYFKYFIQLMEPDNKDFTYHKVSIITKITRIIIKYINYYGQRKRKQISVYKDGYWKVSEKLFEIFQRKIENEQTMKEIITKCLQGIYKNCQSLEELSNNNQQKQKNRKQENK